MVYGIFPKLILDSVNVHINSKSQIKEKSVNFSMRSLSDLETCVQETEGH